ncbi:hypothetical protein BC938DRAFT_475872 [Jimgerdemannia flammicorona]|uniref:Uncharacterized protein n=1 Tax=Jimgerdemannia flammicorona TaxID=994334 RepID=A0A433R0M0_9FUNG|nr:hypothetical protein BC938DRAFT_475872 [Jimgerdemannia flammicorona]
MWLSGFEIHLYPATGAQSPNFGSSHTEHSFREGRSNRRPAFDLLRVPAICTRQTDFEEIQTSDFMDDNQYSVRVAPQNNANSDSQMILKGIPTDVTHANILGVVKMASGEENITVSIGRDNTAIVDGLSADTHRFLISQGVMMVAGHCVKVAKAPSSPSDIYPSTTSADQQSRTNDHHQPGVVRAEAIETTSRPREAKLHSEHYRPMKVQCHDGSFCGQYMVEAHMDRYLHQFNTPCRDAPFACTRTDVNHAAKFSHVCKYGAECCELTDSNHMRNFIHIFRTHCSDGANCTLLLNEEHLDLFSHAEIADIRSPCQYKQECPNRTQSQHVAEYTHPSDGPPISSYDDTCQDINFLGNARKIIKATDVYFKNKGQNFQVPEEVVEWVKRLRPAHRVRPKIFKSILAHHHVGSGRMCGAGCPREQMKPLIDLGDLLVKATRDLATNPEGIQYDVDKLMGTNKQVFSILGPHTEANNRPFMPTGKPKSDEAIEKFHKSKLHTSCSNWAKAAAADICAQIMEATGKTHISLNDVKSEWLKRESHFVFEAHLPSLIPFSFVDKIIIPKSTHTD